jgi:hypothetical protein
MTPGAIVRVHTAEEISREQRHFDFHHPIGPASHVFADGQKAFITCIFQQQARCLLSACPNQDREPRPLLIAYVHAGSAREATAVGVPKFSRPGFGEGLGLLEGICQLKRTSLTGEKLGPCETVTDTELPHNPV